MAKDDWAIVVGIQNYFDPGLTGLQGSENDAQEFHEWVTSSDGGAVPKGQASLIRSRDYPPSATAARAMPSQIAIKEAFDHLLSIAAENEGKGLGRKIGRRLYLFFSGHGFAPSIDINLTALLTADASISEANLAHVIGAEMADHFWKAKFFTEILLFMDCCRSIMDCAQPYKPYTDEFASDFDEGRRFYAYAARVAKESREWKMDTQYHGVFTRTLLDALRGTASDPSDPSSITAESLRDQLYNGFKNFMSPQDRQRPDLRKYPQVEYEEIPGKKFTIVTRGNFAQRIFARGKGTTYKVTIIAPPERLNKKATVRDRKLDVVSEQTLTAPIVLSLPRGLYAIEIAGSAEPTLFEVTGAERELNV